MSYILHFLVPRTQNITLGLDPTTLSSRQRTDLSQNVSSFIHMFSELSLVLWRCWLGGRKGIRPVKNWVVTGGLLVWLSDWNEMQTCIWPSWCHCHSLSLSPVKSRLVLPLSNRLTWVVPGKGPLNVCSLASCHWVSVCQPLLNSYLIDLIWFVSSTSLWLRPTPF